MLVKFRISDETWKAFLQTTNEPSETLRQLINNYLAAASALDQVIGVNEAAELLGLTPGSVKNMCAAGKLPAKKIGQTWVIDRAAIKPR